MQKNVYRQRNIRVQLEQWMEFKKQTSVRIGSYIKANECGQICGGFIGQEEELGQT